MKNKYGENSFGNHKNMKVGFCTDLVVFAWNNTIIMQKENTFYITKRIKTSHFGGFTMIFLCFVSRTLYFDCAIVFFIQEGKKSQQHKLKGISMDKT